MASGRRKVVKWGRCRPVPRGACGAGGAPAPGSGATTPFPEAGVRKHPAPKGALRHVVGVHLVFLSLVRKHPAPKGALRHSKHKRDHRSVSFVRKHPAPEGALRPICRYRRHPKIAVRKHPAPQGALRPKRATVPMSSGSPPENTQHQKVHEGIYRHVLGHRMPIFTLVRQNLDILSSRPSSRSRL